MIKKQQGLTIKSDSIMYKVIFDEIASYKETVISESFGMPYLKEVWHKNERFKDNCDYGFTSYGDAKKRAETLKKISDKKYVNIRIEEY